MNNNSDHHNGLNNNPDEEENGIPTEKPARSDSNNPLNFNSSLNPADLNPADLKSMLDELLKDGLVDLSKLAAIAGQNDDPASIQNLLNSIQEAISRIGNGIDWTQATKSGEQIAKQHQVQVEPKERVRLEQTIHVASLWLDDAVDFAASNSVVELLSRRSWVTRTMPIWIQLSEPVANSIAEALTRVLADQIPEEIKEMAGNAAQVLRGVGGNLFAMQLGHVVGHLATEVVSGGDIGVPLFDEGQSVLLPQNITAFGEGLEVPNDQIELYLTVRELAHGRLFRHAKWLRLHLVTAITAYSRGIAIDREKLETLAEEFQSKMDNFDPHDLNSTDSLREAMITGKLLLNSGPEQAETLTRLETMLALIEGWVDVVTSNATTRLPKAEAIAEAIRRRRAAGGPAESAFATLVGLELRPRQLRAASNFWRLVTEAVGIQAREALWIHPDLLPAVEDLENPSNFIARLKGEKINIENGSFEEALEQLLNAENKKKDENPDL